LAPNVFEDRQSERHLCDTYIVLLAAIFVAFRLVQPVM